MKIKRTLAGQGTGKTNTRQRGQALLWFVGTLAASAAVLYGIHNVGQVTSAKQKVVNAADAGALAGSIAEARALNLMAYGNRAIVANEVFLVQLVSLDSWLRYVSTGADSIATYSRFIPVAGPFISAAFQVAKRAADIADRGMSTFIPITVRLEEVFKRAISGTQGLLVASGGILAQSAASDVVRQNRTVFNGRDDQAPSVPVGPNTAAFAANETRWLNFTRVYSNGDRTRSRDVILASRDSFSTNRPGNALTNVTAPLAARLQKQGGTRLMGFNRWEAQDTWDIQLWNPGKFRWGSALPLGWGRATLDQNSTNGQKWGSSTSQRLAYRNTNRFDGWSGIPSLRDISQTTDTDPRIGFLLFVVKQPGVGTPTTRHLGMAAANTGPAGSPQMDENLARNQVSALSKAEVYFARPQRGIGDWTANGLWRNDNLREYGSLYSPFWQARLTEPSNVERAAALAAVGQVVPPQFIQ